MCMNDLYPVYLVYNMLQCFRRCGFFVSDTKKQMNTSVPLTETDRRSCTSFHTCDGGNSDPDDVETTGRASLADFSTFIEGKDDFRPNGTVGATSLWFRPKTAGKPIISLGEVTVRGSVSLERIVNTVTDLSRKGEWDAEFWGGREIYRRNVDDDTWIRMAWTASKPKGSVAGRDFVLHSYVKKTQSSWCIVSWSVEAVDCPPEYLPKVASADHVRAKLYLGGIHAARTPGNDWKISLVNQAEIVGISSWLTEPVLMKSPSILNSLKRVLELST